MLRRYHRDRDRSEQALRSSEAYFRGKWCAKMDSGGGVVGERCDFPTFETCRSYVNAQPKSWCVQNQWRRSTNKAAFITGGVDGLSGIAMWKLLGIFEFDLAGRTAYLYSLAVLFALFALARRVMSSPFGLSLRAIREGNKRMPYISVRLAITNSVAAVENRRAR